MIETRQHGEVVQIMMRPDIDAVPVFWVSLLNRVHVQANARSVVLTRKLWCMWQELTDISLETVIYTLQNTLGDHYGFIITRKCKVT